MRGHARTCAHMHAHARTCVHMRTHACTCAHMRAHARTCTHMRAHRPPPWVAAHAAAGTPPRRARMQAHAVHACTPHAFLGRGAAGTGSKPLRQRLMNNPCGSRARNRRIRGPTPCPLAKGPLHSIRRPGGLGVPLALLRGELLGRSRGRGAIWLRGVTVSTSAHAHTHRHAHRAHAREPCKTNNVKRVGNH